MKRIVFFILICSFQAMAIDGRRGDQILNLNPGQSLGEFASQTSPNFEFTDSGELNRLTDERINSRGTKHESVVIITQGFGNDIIGDPGILTLNDGDQLRVLRIYKLSDDGPLLFNGFYRCDDLKISSSGTHLECVNGEETTHVNFDGTPLREAGNTDPVNICSESNPRSRIFWYGGCRIESRWNSSNNKCEVSVMDPTQKKNSYHEFFNCETATITHENILDCDFRNRSSMPLVLRNSYRHDLGPRCFSPQAQTNLVEVLQNNRLNGNLGIGEAPNGRFDIPVKIKTVPQ